MCVSQIPGGFHVSFTEEKLLSGHFALKLRLLENYSDGCPPEIFSHLLTGSFGAQP